jgi:hypothetical protein
VSRSKYKSGYVRNFVVDASLLNARLKDSSYHNRTAVHKALGLPDCDAVMSEALLARGALAYNRVKLQYLLCIRSPCFVAPASKLRADWRFINEIGLEYDRPHSNTTFHKYVGEGIDMTRAMLSGLQHMVEEAE